MPVDIPGPFDPAEIRQFLDGFMYERDAFLIDEITRMDHERRVIEAVLDTARPLPYADLQRVTDIHPGHVSGAELVMVTGSLGCLHAWFFHGCRWGEGWTGYGNRIHRADFRKLGRRGPPMLLRSEETRSRQGPDRIVIRYEFRFRQDDGLVYFGDQTAMFVKPD